MCTPSAAFVDLCYYTCFTTQNNLGMILEVNLNNFVAESKHNCVFSPHPLFDIDRRLRRSELFVVVWHPLQLALEVLQQCHFLVEVFGLILEGVFTAHVMFFRRPPFHLVESVRVMFQDHFGRIVEEYSRGPVAE